MKRWGVRDERSGRVRSLDGEGECEKKASASGIGLDWLWLPTDAGLGGGVDATWVCT